MGEKKTGILTFVVENVPEDAYKDTLFDTFIDFLQAHNVEFAPEMVSLMYTPGHLDNVHVMTKEECD